MTEETKVSDDDILSTISEGFASLSAKPEPAQEPEPTQDEDDTQEADGSESEEVTEPDADEGEREAVERPKGRRAQKEYERAEAEKAARLELEAKYAALEAKVNNISDVRALLEPKKPDPTIDDELEKYGIDPTKFEDSYDEDGNLELSAKAQKKLALQDAKTNATLSQIQAQQVLASTANDVDAAIAALRTTQPEYAEMLDNGLTLLVSNQSFIMRENNAQLSERDADTAAYNAIMFELAKRSREQGKTPALVAAEMADRLAKRLNIPLAKQKPLPESKKSSNINFDKAKSLQAQAGAAPIAVASTKQASGGGLSSGFRDYLKSELA